MRELPEVIPALPKIAAPNVVPRKLEQAKIEPAKSELPRVASIAPVAARPKPAPPKEVKTNVFSSSPSETATVQKPARQVQTGGFGDSNGIAGQGDPQRNTATVAHLGSFDLPAGPGQGNGTAGSHGTTGVVRSAGFGDGVSVSNPPRQNRTIAASGFREVVSQDEASPSLQRVSAKPILQPVEILYKPRPAYTAEARRRRLEGEVLLDVVFQASGALRINRVVKGLGFGLDENALAAAQHIQFRPACRDGQPYDYAALVRIVFELSE
jgi:TonB family protein